MLEIHSRSVQAYPNLRRMVGHQLRRSALRPMLNFIGTPVRVETDRPYIALTFDDGPAREVTPAIMEVLEEHHAHATFFVLMTRVHSNPKLVRDIQAAGHEIGLHGVDHRPLRNFTPNQVLARTRRARRELEEITGSPIRWFRPPYAVQSPAGLAAVRSLGMEPVLWDVTTLDWLDVPQEDRVSEAVKGCSAGSILLAHDNFADWFDGVDDGPRPSIDRVDLVARVVSRLSEHGLKSTTVAHLLETGTFDRRVSFER